jgi:LEA14-like dessication related protein
LSYTNLHKLLIAASIAFAAAACTTARPAIKVIAMSQARTTSAPKVLVYMEVVNPTSRDLRLSRLDYRLEADAWFESQGSIQLGRAVAPKSSTIVEIAVPVRRLEGQSADAVLYKLKGRLFARADHVERSWKVDATGEIKTRTARQRFRIPVDVADRQ